MYPLSIYSLMDSKVQGDIFLLLLYYICILVGCTLVPLELPVVQEILELPVSLQSRTIQAHGRQIWNRVRNVACIVGHKVFPLSK